MTLNQFENFTAIVEAGSFSTAAQKLYISPQALIQQVHKMEQEIGFRLLMRSSHGVSLTDAGREYYALVQRFLVDYHETLDRASKIAQNTSVLTIGMPDNVTPAYLLCVCQAFSVRYPHIKLRYKTYTWDETDKALLHKTVDICAQIDRDFKTQYPREKLFSTHHFCLMTRDHPLAKRKTLRPKDLSSYTLGFWGPIKTYNKLADYADAHGLQIQMKSLQKTFPYTLNFCEEGNIFIGRAPLIDALKGSLAVIPFDFDFDILYYLAYTDALNPATQKFLSIARDIAQSDEHPWRKSLKSLQIS